ncbi:MAG: hypothetical protein AAF771_13750 [Pseudomonadota bacterium]
MEFGLLLRALGGIWIILAVAVGFGAASHYQGQRETAVYEANAMLLYRFGREYYNDNVVDTTWRGDGIRLNVDLAINNDLEIMGSRSVMAKTLEALGAVDPENQEIALQFLEPGVPDLSAAEQLAAFREQISIRRIQGTNMVRVAALNPDVEQAVVTLEALLDTYIAERDDILTRQPIASLEATRDAARANIDRIREEETALRLENGIFDEATQRSTILARIATLETTPPPAVTAAVPGSVVVPSNVAVTPDPEVEIAELRTRLDEMEAVSAQLRDLSRERGVYEDELRQVAGLLREYELANTFASEVGHPIAVIEEPAPAPGPVGLSPNMRTALAAIIGALIGYLISVIRESFRMRKTATPEPAPEGAAWASGSTAPRS